MPSADGSHPAASYSNPPSGRATNSLGHTEQRAKRRWSEHGIVQIDDAGNETGYVYLELSDGDDAEAKRGLALLKKIVGRAGGEAARSRLASERRLEHRLATRPIALATRAGRSSSAMGISAWCFQRRRPGELNPLAQSAVEAFMSKGGRLPTDPEGFVRYAEVIVSVEDRRAVEVLRIGFYQYRARKNGTLDRKHYDEILHTVPEAAFGGLRTTAPSPGVIPAEHRFAKRRLEHLSQWRPTDEEHRQLAELVNRRAGRELL